MKYAVNEGEMPYSRRVHDLRKQLPSHIFL